MYSRPSLISQMVDSVPGPTCTSKYTSTTTVTAAVSTQKIRLPSLRPTTSCCDSSSSSQYTEPRKPYSSHTTMALICTMRLTLKSSTP